MNLKMILLLFLVKTTMALIAYDCGTPNMNITTTSLLDIGSCKIPTADPVVEEKHLQLLQLADYSNIHVIQCKVEVDRIIFYCGMHSHVSIVNNGRMSYLMDISEEQCSKMHLWKGFTMPNGLTIYGLKKNATITRGINLAGSINNDGQCKGTQFSDPYGTWDNVVVQASVKFSLSDYFATVRGNDVILLSGMQCTLAEGNCMDNGGAGQTFWTPTPVDNCKFNQYDVLYEGMANRIYDNTTNSENIQEIYSITTDDITFALTRKGRKNMCGHTLIRTEHPKLFILEIPKNDVFIHRKSIQPDNLDIFAYVNSKFVYLEKHIKNQMTTLYRDVIKQRCSLERQVLKNALTLATLVPDEFAYHIMKGPGYMASIMGEVIHIAKCLPVEVKVRKVEECYLQLPVYHGNRSMFISPRSHMLMKTGTQVNCNSFVPPMYRVEGMWFKFLPHATEAVPPQIIQPITSNEWQYSNPKNLATSGIYATEDLEKLRDHLMFPAERPAILNTIARGVSGENIQRQGISVARLMDEDTIDQIASSAWNHMWGWFTGFGTFSAGMLGIFMIFKFLKFILDTLIHGYALHSVFGWSIHLLGAFWDSITNLLLHLRKGVDEAEQREQSKDKQVHENIPDIQEIHTSIYPPLPTAPEKKNTTIEINKSNSPQELRYSLE